MKTFQLYYICNHISVNYTDVILFSDFISLSNIEGWSPTEVAYEKKRSVFPNYFRLRTEGVLSAPASQSLIY